MDAEDWKEFREHGKDVARKKKAENLSVIETWCKTNNIEYDNPQGDRVRMTIGKTTIDVFPKSKKYHNITTQVRGTINKSITGFLNNLL